jgi:hypothetical protein
MGNARMQANRGVGQPPLCKLSIPHPDLGTLKEWLGLHGIHLGQWVVLSLKEWWSLMEEGASPHREAVASLALFTMWEL